MASVLYYIHDPMCAWCWGFCPVWDEIQAKLPASVRVEYVVGGLAPDTDLPMPVEMQRAIQGYWRKIQQMLGTEFNFDFWEKNVPRRATYDACRAVIAAKAQGFEKDMVDAIQRAYYLQALNPSDKVVLIGLAKDLYNEGLSINCHQFEIDLMSMDIQQELNRQIALARELTDRGFPSLVLEHDRKRTMISLDYNNYLTALMEINTVIN